VQRVFRRGGFERVAIATAPRQNALRRSWGKIELDRGDGEVDPILEKPSQQGGEDPQELLSRIIEDLNARFGAELTEEDRITLRAVMDQLEEDAALDSAVRSNTRENIRLTFDEKLEDRLQGIIDSNFKLYKRFTDDPPFNGALLDHLFDTYMSKRRQAEELIRLGESKTVELKSTLRWDLREEKKDPKAITQAVLKTIAAFLNTEGGDLLIGVADDGEVLGTEMDKFDNDDKYIRHLSQSVQNALGDRSGSCIDPRIQTVDGKSVCVVSCQRSPEPVFLKWKKTESSPDGDFYIRSGPSSIKLSQEDTEAFIQTRFGAS
jgi:hypothetical protein